VAATTSSETAAQTMLLFRAGGEEPKAVPLELVARLEVLAKGQIERSGGHLVTQYRGKLMPLVAMNGDVGGHDLKEQQPVLVFYENERNAGLVVDEILDIVDSAYTVDLKSASAGVIGSAVIAGKATDLVDVSYYLAQAAGDWFSPETEKDYGASQGSRRLLLVDDSPFFRNMLKPLLASAGYNVTTCESAELALQMIENGENFDVVISDIEMPKIDGYHFAEALHRSERWHGTPMIALTSHFTAQDQERSRQSGFARHIAKFSPGELLRAISDVVGEKEAA
jgi:two-component system chemotaxis sensor kinase CheA